MPKKPKTYTTIDRAATKEITDETLAALQTVADAHDLSVRYTKGRYDEALGRCLITFEFTLGSIDVAKAEWVRYCASYGFKDDDYGREFVYGGKTYKLHGFRTRAPKKPILAMGDDGKMFVFPLQLAKLALAAA